MQKEKKKKKGDAKMENDETTIKIKVLEKHEEIRKELYDHLDDVFCQFGPGHCSGKLKLTRRFLKKKELTKTEFEEMILLLQHFGGYCDCEVVFNVYKPFPVGKVVVITV